MDFHAAMETFAEAWVAANTQTAVNSDVQNAKQTAVEDLPTLLPKDQLVDRSQGPGGGESTPAAATLPLVKPGGGNSQREDKTPSPKKPDTTTQSTGGSGKSVPIHCLVEQTAGVPSFKGVTSTPCSGNSVELDSYAILPSSTLLSDLVRTALLKLGYTAVDAINAKGAIQIRNWKPLTFDAITENAQATVDDILGELTNVATLRIRLASPRKLSTAEEIKDKLLQLLLSHSQGLLNEAGCPIEKALLSSLSRGEKPDSLSDDMLIAFDKWYRDQVLMRQRPLPLLAEKTPDMEKTIADPVKPASPIQSAESKENQTANALFNHCRTRIRTSFDPEHEIPRLQKWFQDNQHPTREQMIHYMNELNTLESRKGRRPLDLTNIIYWFKNARAAQRRASKAMDDSFEGEENGEVATTPGPGGGIPYLPNKNAVYMIPFPFNSHMMPGTSPLSDEPCDLSVGKKQARENEAESLVSKASPIDRMSVPILKENNDLTQNSVEVKHELPDSCEPEREMQTKPEMGFSNMNGLSNSSMETSASQEREDHAKDNINNNSIGLGNHANIDVNNMSSSSPDEERMEDRNKENYDDEDDYDSSDDMSDQSVSGDEPVSMIKRENDCESDYRMRMQANCSAANMAALSLAQMAQPLHVPQLPPPLMTYYPVNARFYSPQSNNMNPHGSPPHTPHKHHESRKRRTRVFIDPLTEIPKLEKWFLEDTHPSAYMIDKYCEELNRSEYRAKFPPLEPKNVQLWFKNHRAKVKRMRLST